MTLKKLVSNNYFLLISLFLVSLFIRIILINQFPPSLNWDEASHGYNAYSILKTGKDEWGIKFPLIFRAFGDYKLPLYIYLTVPFISIFGLNPLSVRLVSIIAGSLLPVIIYLIIRKLNSSRIVAYLGALIISLSPWSIFISRIALEANLFLTLFCASFLFLLRKNYPASTVFFGLCLFTYNSSRILLPFYIISVLYLMWTNRYPLSKNFNKFIFFLICSGLFLYQSFNGTGQARYKWVSLLDQGAINKINELRQDYPRILVNKYTYFTYAAGSNYLSHYKPGFTFFSGGSHYQFSIPGFYLISPFFLPLLLIGIYACFKENKPELKLLLFWFLVAPIPSAVTKDAPHVLRSIVFLPIITILVSLGISYVSKKIKTVFLLFAVLILFAGQIGFWKNYKTYSTNYSSSWQYGYQQVVDFISKEGEKYDQIWFTKKYGEAHEFVLFYLNYDPSIYHANKNWDYHADWYWVNGFDRYLFINDWEIKDKSQNIRPKTLLITSPDNYSPNGANLIKSVYFLNGQRAFDILSYD